MALKKQKRRTPSKKTAIQSTGISGAHYSEEGYPAEEKPAKLDIAESGVLVKKEILPEQEYGSDYHFKNKALDQLYFLRFLKSGIELTLDNLLDYLSYKNIRAEYKENNKAEHFLVISGLSLSPLKEYNIETENEFFNVNKELSRLQRDVFLYNGIIQIAGPIGAGKSSIAASMEVRAPAKIYNEMRPNRFIEDWLEDDLYLYLLYSDPGAFFALFNISKPHIFKELFEQGLKELKQGTFRGVEIFDRTREENRRFLNLALNKGYASEKDIEICNAINTYCIELVDASDSTILRLLKTPEGCQELIHGQRAREQETKKDIIISDKMNSALYHAKAEMLNAADNYLELIKRLKLLKNPDLRQRYSKAIYKTTRYEKITPITVDLDYSKSLEEAYSEFIDDFRATGFKGVIVNLDVEDWTRINNDAQQMKLSDIVTMAQCIYHMKGGCKLDYDSKRQTLKLPFGSTSRTILLTTK